MRDATARLGTCLLVALFWVACGDSGSTADPPDASTDADGAVVDSGSDGGPTDAAADVAVGDDGGGATDGGATDGGPTDGGPMACDEGETHLYVMDVIRLGRESPEGVAPGLNLDDRVSDGSDALGCNQPDFTSPDGDPGIDNQLAVALPNLEDALSVDFDAQLQSAVQSGDYLVLVQLEGVNDFTDDDCVVVSMMTGLLPAGVSMPTLDGSGRFEPGQTFDIDAASFDAVGTPYLRMEGRITAGVLETERAELPFRLPIDETTALELTLHDGMLQAEPSAEALQEGVWSGGLGVDELVTAFVEVEPSLSADILRGSLESLADLDPVDATSAECNQLSMVALFEATRAVRGETVP